MSSERDYESRLFETAPSPAQLERLSQIGARSAEERGRLRSPSEVVRTFIDEHEQYEKDLVYQENVVKIRHRIAGRLGMEVPLNTYEPRFSFYCLETYMVRRGTEVWGGERTSYRFEWDKAGVYLAERSLRLVDAKFVVEKDPEISDYILEPSLIDFKSIEETSYMRDEFSTITSADVDDLAERFEDYYSQFEVPDQAA